MVLQMRRDDWADILNRKTNNPLIEEVVSGLLAETKARGVDVRIVDLDGSVIGRS